MYSVLKLLIIYIIMGSCKTNLIFKKFVIVDDNDEPLNKSEIITVDNKNR